MRDERVQFLRLDTGASFALPLRDGAHPAGLRERIQASLSAGPSAIAVPALSLPAVLAALGKDAVDRGIKNPNSPLKRLWNDSRISVIRATYSKPGQLINGLRGYLKEGIRLRTTGACVVGVDEALFLKAWNRSRQDRESACADESSSPGCAAALLNLLPHEPEPPWLVSRLAGLSPAIAAARQLIVKAGASRQTVLILGDMGVGKTAAAHCIHELGHKGLAPGKFITANCLAMASGRYEAELFGEVIHLGSRGRSPRIPGLWEEADGGGTLYLDEIGALKPHQQSLLNSALESGEFKPCGGKRMKLPAAQVIASSSRDLGALTRTGEFLPELFYRLREFAITLPPLRERPADIIPIACTLWADLAGGKAPRLTPEVLNHLHAYPWPGNVRELKAALCRLKTLYPGRTLTPGEVETIMAGQGFPAPTPVGQNPKQEQIAERMRCVRHLLRAEDIALSLRHLPGMGKPARGKGRKGALPPAEAVERLLGEMDLLFLAPGLFGSADTYVLMNALKGKIHYFHDLCRREPASALAFLKNDLAATLDAAPAFLGKETARLLA
jgi:transcriptional regulator with AAA-type ATPase domain